jgi:hypothetical protein
MAEHTQPDPPRMRILQVAEKMLSGDLDLFEGCHEIHGLRHHLEDPDDEAFLVIAGVASETDVYPIGDARTYWDPQALARQDRERDEYMSRVREVVWEACRAIISKPLMTS